MNRDEIFERTSPRDTFGMRGVLNGDWTQHQHVRAEEKEKNLFFFRLPASFVPPSARFCRAKGSASSIRVSSPELRKPAEPVAYNLNLPICPWLVISDVLSTPDPHIRETAHSPAYATGSTVVRAFLPPGLRRSYKQAAQSWHGGSSVGNKNRRNGMQ